MTHASGPSEFRAPPLPKGEISNGISGILEENEVYHTRPRGLNLYGPYEDQEDLEIDLLGKRKKNTSFHRTVSSVSSIPPTPIFDPERLPHAYGPKTTETLIEALFNPVVVGERRRESPFTVFVDPAKPPLRPHLSSISGMPPRSPGTAARPTRPTTPASRPPPARSASASVSGIGAGLGIMGLGMGMGVGMGVGVGVEGGRGSLDLGSNRTSLDGGSRRASQDGSVSHQSLAASHNRHARTPSRERRVVPSHGHPASDKRQASQGSVWSASTGADADADVGGSVESGVAPSVWTTPSRSSTPSSSSVHGKGGMKGWFKKKMGSRPGTPTLAY